MTYSAALDLAGCRMESLLYLGNALRINAYAVPDELKEVEPGWERELLRLIKEQRKRHYILLDPPCAHSKNVKGYYESIAIMLRNMGNCVSIVELQDTLTVDIEYNKNNKTALLCGMLNTAEKQDRVYDWDIVKYKTYRVEMSEGKQIAVSDFLACLAEEKSERELSQQWADKKVNPFGIGREINKVGAEEIILRKDRITVMEHYMRNEESLCGMLSVLKAVEELSAS